MTQHNRSKLDKIRRGDLKTKHVRFNVLISTLLKIAETGGRFASYGKQTFKLVLNFTASTQSKI